MRRKIDWKKVIDVHIWAIKQWWKIDPKLFFSTGLHAIASAVAPYVTVWFSARIINELAGNRDANTLWKWVILTVCVTAGMKLLTEALYHWKELVHGMEDDLETKFRADKLMNMDFAAVEAPETNELRLSMRKFAMGNSQGFLYVHGYYTEAIIGGAASVISAIALTVSLFTSRVSADAGSWSVLDSGWVSAGVILLLLAGTILAPTVAAKSVAYNEQLWPYNNRYNRAYNIFAMLGMDTKRMVDVRMYNQQDIANDLMEDSFPFRKGSPACRIVFGKQAPLEALSTAISTMLIGVAYVFVCLKAWAGAFGIGSVTQYVGAVTNLCSGIIHVFYVIGDLPNNANYLYAIREFIEIPNDMYQGSLPTEKRDDREYEVEFKDVSFKYPGSDIWALRHVNMKFKVGSRLAVVGMNGSGKTTFIKLLCRLYDPTEGEILLNGINIRKYKYDDYMNVFSIVFQDFKLTAMPLGENLAASQNYDRALAEDCLRKAGFGERLDSLEMGLDTYITTALDKQGVSFSGGEQQKIAIARALYKDSPFIILDEPTAALDPIAEAEIYSKFNDIAGDKTAIYISHRLSSCKFCDEIAVFHEGAVIQQGSHEALVADKNGKYYELWNAQAQYYTEKRA